MTRVNAKNENVVRHPPTIDEIKRFAEWALSKGFAKIRIGEVELVAAPHVFAPPPGEPPRQLSPEEKKRADAEHEERIRNWSNGR